MKKVAYSALYSLLYLLGLIILYLIIGYIVEKLYGYPQQSSDAYLLYNPFVVVGKTMKAYIVGLIVSINILVYLFISKRMDKFLFIPFFTISAMLLTIFVYALFLLKYQNYFFFWSFRYCSNCLSIDFPVLEVRSSKTCITIAMKRAIVTIRCTFPVAIRIIALINTKQ